MPVAGIVGYEDTWFKTSKVLPISNLL